MKVINLIGALLFILTNTACSEDDNNQSTSEPKANPLSLNATENPQLIPFAGQDLMLIKPEGVGWLSGSYSFNETIENVLWTKISGPSSYHLESPNTLRTKISNLENGIYEFELTLIAKSGKTAKDTVKITVGELSKNPQELHFADLIWIEPWDFAVEIKNFNTKIPPNVFKVFIQRDNDPIWTEVTALSDYDPTSQQRYTYFIESRSNSSAMYNYGSLYILYYGKDAHDTPTVKIIY